MNYIYGLLHSPEYRSRFSSDLKKMLPRIPLTQETADYKKFTQAGRALAEWHLNYETSEPYALLPTTHDHAAFDRFGVPDQRELGALGGGGYCNLAEIAAEK